MGGIIICSLAIMFIITIGLHKRFPGSFGLLLAGGLAFFVSQIIIRTPCVAFLQGMQTQPWLYLILMAGSAALVETIARGAVIRFCLKERLSWSGGLSAGLGHGFCEILFVLVFPYLTTLFMHFTGVELETLSSMVMNTPSWVYVFPLLERIFVTCFHMAMYLMIVQGWLKGKKQMSILLVFVLHFCFDGATLFLQMRGMSLVYVEVFVALCGVMSLIYIIQMSQKMQDHFNLPKDPGEQALEEGY